jgi:hypothetical protein
MHAIDRAVRLSFREAEFNRAATDLALDLLKAEQLGREPYPDLFRRRDAARANLLAARTTRRWGR